MYGQYSKKEVEHVYQTLAARFPRKRQPTTADYKEMLRLKESGAQTKEYHLGAAMEAYLALDSECVKAWRYPVTTICRIGVRTSMKSLGTLRCRTRVRNGRVAPAWSMGSARRHRGLQLNDHVLLKRRLAKLCFVNIGIKDKQTFLPRHYTICLCGIYSTETTNRDADLKGYVSEMIGALGTPPRSKRDVAESNEQVGFPSCSKRAE